MFRIQYIAAHKLVGINPEDAAWVDGVATYATAEHAEAEKEWLAMDGKFWAYRVAIVARRAS